GMGAVYEGENTRIARRVAIKVLHSGVAEMGEAVARFEREAQAAGRIGSEHICEVLDLGNLPSGDRYLVMEFMDGDSLSRRIRQRGQLTPSELYPIAHQLLDGLMAAHAAGIIHRDLKPDNIFVLRSKRGGGEFVKLLDFGISKFTDGGSNLSMTRTGTVMGTPYYMAPEQARGSRELDARVDLYAVGVILYEALTGQVPFMAETFNELLFKIVLETPRPIGELVPGAEPSFVAIVEKAMSRDPALRFQSALEFQQALEKWASGGFQVTGSTLAVGQVPPMVSALQNTGNRGLSQSGGRASSPQLGTQTGPHGQQLGATSESWAGASAPNLQLPTHPRRPLWIVGSVVGLLVVIGIGFAVRSGLKTDTPAAASSNVLGTTPPTAAPSSPPDIRVEPAPSVPPPVVNADASSSSAEANSEPAPSASARPTAAPRASIAVRAPAPRPTSPPVAPPVDPRKSAQPASTGRKIRTSL
ncbi:MAG TPA: protein kinase, partial [Polyangiaceae bacterium]|nr:protein kinase [Polyangiaceae bacterium]